MATIEDLGRQLKQQFPQYAALSDIEVGRRAKAARPEQYGHYTEPGLGATALEALKATGQHLLGAAAAIPETIGGLAKGVYQASANSLQAIAPGDLHIPGATEAPISGVSPVQRGLVGLDALSMGVLGNMAKRVQAEEAATANRTGNDEPTIGSRLWDSLKGSLKSVAMDILPGQGIGQLVSGHKPSTLGPNGEEVPGAPLSNYERGKLAVEVPMQGLLAAGLPGIKDLIPGGQKGILQMLGGDDVPRTNRVITQQEISSAAPAAADVIRGNVSTSVNPKGQVSTDVPTGAAQDLVSKPGTMPLPDHAQALADSMTPEQKAATAMNFRLEIPEVRAVAKQVVMTDTFKAVRLRLANMAADEQPRFTHYIAESIREGALDPEVAIAIQQKYGFTPEETATKYAQLMEYNLKESGGMQATISDAKRLSDTVMEAHLEGNPELMRQLKQMEAHTSGNEPATSWDKFVTAAQRLEKYRRALVVAPLATQMRNLDSHSLIGLNQALEHVISGTVEALASKGFNKSAYTDLAGDFSTAASRFSPESRAALDSLLNQIPLVKDTLTNAAQFDFQVSTVKNLMKRQMPETFHEAADALTAFPTVGMHLGNIELRKAYFQQRLLSNLEAAGYRTDGVVSGLSQFEEILKSPEALGEDGRLLPEHKAIIADALDHSLKQTMAWTPTAGLGKGILDTYQKIPFATAVLPTFPRFWMNQMRWLTERSPGIWLELFNKDFRDKLGAGGLEGRQAAQALGKGFTGLMNLTAAWTLRNSDAAGDKYYQFKTSQQGEGATRDLEIDAYHPFTPYFFLADLIKSAKNGTPMNLNNREWIDAVTLLKGIEDTPAFDVTDMLRKLKTDEVDNQGRTFAERAGEIPKSVAGRYMASFFAPFRTADSLASALQQQPVRDIHGRDLLGPTQQLVHPSGLPAAPDIFTGKPLVSEQHPLLHELTGLKWRDYPQLKEELDRYPEITLNSLIGEHGSPTANRLVGEQLGKFMAVAGPQLTQALQSLPDNTPREFRVKLIREVFGKFRDLAEQSAKATAVGEQGVAGYSPFIGKDLAKVPQEFRPQLRRVLAAQGIKVIDE